MMTMGVFAGKGGPGRGLTCQATCCSWNVTSQAEASFRASGGVVGECRALSAATTDCSTAPASPQGSAISKLWRTLTEGGVLDKAR